MTNLKMHAGKIAEACRTIEMGEEEPSLADLAGAAGMSRFYFHRMFKELTGLTPKAYAVARRAERVRDALSKHKTVTEAIYEAGFNSSGRFYENAGAALGMAPGRFQSGGEGETIRFAVGECSLGAILVASSERGVCCISMSDQAEELVIDLQKRFAKAHLVGADKSFERVVALVVGLVEAPKLGWDLPLDVRGTVFQRRVWQALRDIPLGSTSSYAEIAKRIGSPGAVRAVAGACGANSLAVVIPCHRVVRTDGGISGYRWGVARKKALLEREKLWEWPGGSPAWLP